MRKLRSEIRRSRWNPLGTVVRVDTADPVVALTFDDGPDPVYTPRLLDVLDRHGARATFFMIGAAARRHPDLVADVASRGHCVANHTYRHPSLPAFPGRRRRDEIRRCAKALAPHGTRLFRPPKGHQSVGSRLDAFWCRHLPVAWSAAADDWRRHEPPWLASRVTEQLGPGEIVLLHDGLWDPESRGAADRGPVVEAVDLVLERCSARFDFVTLPEQFDRGEPVRWSWFNAPPAEREP
ncbi:MAG: polysaccharide deacetylase family protein [Gemmatimonadota bacterium]